MCFFSCNSMPGSGCLALHGVNPNLKKWKKKSQFKYCPLMWMFCSRKASKKINKLHERALKIIYQDDISNFEELLEKENSFWIHYLCQTRYTWTSKLFVIFVWWKSHKCPSVEVIESQRCTHFFYNQLNFSSQPQVGQRRY